MWLWKSLIFHAHRSPIEFWWQHHYELLGFTYWNFLISLRGIVAKHSPSSSLQKIFCWGLLKSLSFMSTLEYLALFWSKFSTFGMFWFPKSPKLFCDSPICLTVSETLFSTSYIARLMLIWTVDNGLDGSTRSIFPFSVESIKANHDSWKVMLVSTILRLGSTLINGIAGISSGLMGSLKCFISLVFLVQFSFLGDWDNIWMSGSFYWLKSVSSDSTTNLCLTDAIFVVVFIFFSS